MRECPNCNDKTITTKWLLINKSNYETAHCFECSNCNAKIKKEKFFILNLLTVDIFTVGFLVLILTTLIKDYLPSLAYALIISILFFTALRLSTEYLAPLKVAEKNYCLNGLTRKSAFLALLLMVMIILMTIYCLIIQPFILNVSSCS